MKVWYCDNSGCNVTLSDNEIYDWAHRPGAAWPCSTWQGPLFVSLGPSGDIEELDCKHGTDGDAEELSAMLADLLKFESTKAWRPKQQRQHLAEYAESQLDRV